MVSHIDKYVISKTSTLNIVYWKSHFLIKVKTNEKSHLGEKQQTKSRQISCKDSPWKQELVTSRWTPCLTEDCWHCLHNPYCSPYAAPHTFAHYFLIFSSANSWSIFGYQWKMTARHTATLLYSLSFIFTCLNLIYPPLCELSNISLELPQCVLIPSQSL